MTEIQVPKLPSDAGSAYLRLHRVEGNFAIVNAAAVVEKGFKSVRLGLGGVGPNGAAGRRLDAVKNGLSDEALNARACRRRFEVSADAYGDLNGDAEYRRAMAQVYAVRAVARPRIAPS